MKVIALVMADAALDPLGAPGTLAADLAGQSALRRTLERVSRVAGLEGIVLAGPADQEARLRELAGSIPLRAVLRTQQAPLRGLLRAARAFGRYGWRGGLGGTTVYDEIYDPAAALEVLAQSQADALLLVSGGAALLDVGWATAMLERLREGDGRHPLTFCQAPPGLAGLAITGKTLRGLVASRQYPGRMFAYQPGGPIADAIHQAFNVTLPDALIATYRRFLADSPRGLWLCRQLLAQAGDAVDGETACRIARSLVPEPWPRELTIELTCRRPLEDDLRPPGDRPDLAVESLPGILAGLEEAGDINILLGGAGDALLHPQWPAAAAEAAKVGVVALATYGTNLDERTTAALIDSPVSVVQVYVDAISEAAYSTFKRGGSAAAVWTAIESLFERAHKAGRDGLMIVPTMLKTAETLEEQDEFFDRCLKTTGWGLFIEPGTAAGQWPDRAVVHMAPPVRTACRRLATRLTVLSDGTVTACDEDIRAARPLGDRSVLEAWRGGALAELRERHAAGQWEQDVLCGKCEEFHRA